MKVILLLVGVLFTFSAKAASQKLYCPQQASPADFYADLILDNSGPGYAALKGASLIGGFMNANLVCSSDREIFGIKCVGFINDVDRVEQGE
jgi:hypothetical protein